MFGEKPSLYLEGRVLQEQGSRKTVKFEEQIMSKNKHIFCAIFAYFLSKHFLFYMEKKMFE